LQKNREIQVTATCQWWACRDPLRRRIAVLVLIGKNIVVLFALIRVKTPTPAGKIITVDSKSTCSHTKTHQSPKKIGDCHNLLDIVLLINYIIFCSRRSGEKCISEVLDSFLPQKDGFLADLTLTRVLCER